MDETSNTAPEQVPDGNVTDESNVVNPEAHLESNDSTNSELPDEQPEETEEKKFSQAELNSILKKEKETLRRKYQSEYQQQYGAQNQFNQEGGQYQQTQNQAPQNPEFAQFQQQMQEYQQQQEVAKIIQNEQKSLAEASKRYHDFEDVVQDPTLPISMGMKQAIALTGNPGDFWYEAAKNHRSELDRISTLPLAMQQAEILRLEGRLSAGKQARVTGAPQPMTQEPNTGRSTTRATSVDDLIRQETQAYNDQRQRNRR